MKIVYNINSLVNSSGMERVLANKANYLVNLGNDVTIITTDQKNRKSFYTLDKRINLIDLDINYENNNSKYLLKRIILHLYKIRVHKQKLKKILFDIKADIVVSMFYYDAHLLYKIKDGSKKILESHFNKLVHTSYNGKGISSLIQRYKAYQAERTILKYDRFIVLTQEDKNLWGDLHNIHVIHNANTFEFSEQANLSSKIAIAVGRYEYQKGFDNLINIWKIVNKKHPDWKLNIFGKGYQKDYLQNIINDLKLSSVVTLCPVTKNIKDEYLKASMLVATSRFEGFLITLLEAQACGMPLVSYACKCGPRDIIQHNENGFLINEGDKNEMANKIMKLIEDEDLREKMGQKSIEFSKNFSKEKIMTQWMDLFNNLILENNCT